LSQSLSFAEVWKSVPKERACFYGIRFAAGDWAVIGETDGTTP